MELLLWFILVMNVLSFLVMGWDKRQARKRKQRISEKRLWTLTVFGGSAGILAGMFVFRHKTRAFLFKAGVPAVFLIHVIIILFLFLYGG